MSKNRDSSPGSIQEHAAPGSAAGFMFQPERALLHLAQGGERVGIETGDDVVSEYRDGSTISEQAKHSLAQRNPFQDRSKSLWRTLQIWIQAIERGEIDPTSTELHLVTNAVVGGGLAKSLSTANSPPELDSALELLREVGRSIQGTVADFTTDVLDAKEANLRGLIKALVLVDGSHKAGQGIQTEIGELLPIPDHLPLDSIVESLLGWIHTTCMECWRARKAAWLSRSAFKERFGRVLSRHMDRRIVERTADMIPVSTAQRERHKTRLFLRQLELLCFDDEEPALEALDDFIRCLDERTRLLEKGLVTGGDLKELEDRLVQRWRPMARRFWGRQQPPHELAPEQAGSELYHESLNHRELLAGVQTEQYYLTRGHLHRLADFPPRIGWHPDYIRLLGINAN